MLKKIDQAGLFIEKNQHLFRCPTCHTGMQGQGHTLTCATGHRFDLSKKGTLYFLDHQIKTGYDDAMFAPRGRMIAAGMYEPVLQELATYLTPHESLLDVGCGEGSFLADLSRKGLAGDLVGFDISKEGVYLATNQQVAAFWCIADLTNLPFADNSFSTILNIFSPSHYEEFKRTLQAGGQVVKVVPQAGYLKELRQAFYPDQVEKQTYSNEAVVNKFKEHLDNVSVKRITYTFDIPIERRQDLLHMSPLEWQVDPTRFAYLMAHPLSTITIDLELLKGSKKD